MNNKVNLKYLYPKGFRQNFRFYRSLNYRIGNRRRNNKYSRNKHIPVISNKPVTLGTGSTTLNVTFTHTASADQNLDTILVNDILSTSTEYVLRESEYAYVRINYIKVIFFPSIFGQYQTDLMYLYMNWVNDNTMTLDQVKNSDNVKIVPVFQTRNKVYTFIPPNVMVNGYNPRIFHSTQVTPYQGTIYIGSASPQKLIRIEINLLFRGSRDYQISQLIGKLNNLKLLKEEEEKEIEEEEEIEMEKESKKKKKLK